MAQWNHFYIQSRAKDEVLCVIVRENAQTWALRFSLSLNSCQSCWSPQSVNILSVIKKFLLYTMTIIIPCYNYFLLKQNVVVIVNMQLRWLHARKGFRLQWEDIAWISCFTLMGYCWGVRDNNVEMSNWSVFQVYSYVRPELYFLNV